MVPSGGYRGFVLAALFLMLGLSAGTAGPERGCPDADYGERFHEALEAARADDWSRVAELEPCLGDAHPMAAYLDFHRLRSALPEVDPQRVVAYRQRYAGTPLADVLKRVALRRYAEAGDDAAVRRVTDEPPSRLALRCHWWQAHLETRRGEALAFARRTWHAGVSRPSACDGLFEAARGAGVIDDRAVWERMRLAFRNEQAGLMRYLEGLLGGERWLVAAEWLQRLDRNPARIIELDEGLPPRLRRQLTADGLYRLARVDTAAARSYLEQSGDGLAELPAGERREVFERVAWYSIIRGIPENRGWVDRWLAEQDDTDLLEQRMRRAVIEEQWTDLVYWYTRLPEASARSARWQYWLGRARAELGDPALAGEHWREAAGERSFWGFMAAERVGRPYALREVRPEPDPPAPDPALLRVRLLHGVGELRLARDEWRHLLQGREAAEQRALAAHAYRQGWHELAVVAANRAGAHEALQWRFPHAYRDAFRRAAAETGIESCLLMAVARRESGFHRDAVSPAGARGLMQLLPGTARQMARSNGEPLPDARALNDPELNVRLGAEYMQRLLERFEGNRPKALAAYNAGPSRVAGWLERDGRPLDVWIESIPYYETRRYVQAVLAYRTILAHRGGLEPVASVVTHEEMALVYGEPMDDREPATVRLSRHPADGPLPGSDGPLRD
ncbi:MULTISPECIES: transglycosylase SLT domain-containing protein [unclassified Halorhodospira]|uniref:transglycosylase SLT domain-containing protein n=1 Tax=unclassified Halorhodospira TaxID=2626748 RepID=UPI001EE80B01|nr:MULTISPECIES: transglycosylase SLT domain-containing protein [unclassified Halorhodospira]MCG5541272.1 transglycosylase SLT domain-containing protein [Halorhodospira sp. M39old]MCG5546490.1 transglycosylase SLT domain-containing protein [Halorhodospira sp. M38]